MVKWFSASDLITDFPNKKYMQRIKNAYLTYLLLPDKHCVKIQNRALQKSSRDMDMTPPPNNLSQLALTQSASEQEQPVSNSTIWPSYSHKLLLILQPCYFSGCFLISGFISQLLRDWTFVELISGAITTKGWRISPHCVPNLYSCISVNAESANLSESIVTSGRFQVWHKGNTRPASNFSGIFTFFKYHL